MAIGRTFKEAFGKAWRGLERTGADLGAAHVESDDDPPRRAPRCDRARFHLIERALAGHDVDAVADASKCIRGSSTRSRRSSSTPTRCAGRGSPTWVAAELLAVKRVGSRRPDRARDRFFGIRRATTAGGARRDAGVQVRRHVRRRVPAHTPYLYSSYEEESEVTPAARPRVVILGAGPNRIGRGSSSTTPACTRRSPSRTPGSSR